MQVKRGNMDRTPVNKIQSVCTVQCTVCIQCVGEHTIQCNVQCVYSVSGSTQYSAMYSAYTVSVSTQYSAMYTVLLTKHMNI